MVDVNSSIEVVQDNIGSFAFTKAAYSSTVISLIIFFLGLIIGKIMGKLVHKLLHEFEINRVFKSFFGMNIRAEEMIGDLVSFVIYIVFIIWSIDRLGNSALVFKIIVIVIIITTIIALLIGMKDAIPNFIAGFSFYLNKKKLNVGDQIKVGVVEGTVETIDLIETVVRTKEKDTVYIPNAYLIKNMVLLKRPKDQK